MGEVIKVDFPKEKSERTERIKEALKKLPQYRGEVPSRNTIRSLPDIAVGEIYWVEMDNKAYTVADIKGKKITIKALDETATVSTGMTIFDMNKGIISKEPLFDFENKAATADRLVKWFNEDCPPNTYYLIYGRDLHYVTLIKTPDGEAPADIFDKIVELIKPVGDLISMDFNTSEGAPSVEIWVRTKDSPAELMYLFGYDKGLVEL